MTTEQPSFGPRWIVACIECLYACAYDVAARSTRRQWHPAGRAVFWLLASEAMRLAAVRATLMRVATVPLDVERLERHRKRCWLRCAGCSCRGTSQCMRSEEHTSELQSLRHLVC